jgi:hypothetical protein
MIRQQLLLTTLIALLAVGAQARAELIVVGGSLEIPPNGRGFLDFTIRSDTGMDLLDVFGVQFLITATDTRRLEFVDPPTDPQLGDPGYILFGDSASAAFPPASVVSPPGAPITYIGGDGTLSKLGVSVPTSDRLLVSLEVTAATLNPPAVGDVFTIGLIDFGGNTFFEDPSFTPILFARIPGTVTIIPEPPTLLLLLGVMSCCPALYAWRRRWRRPAG